MTLQDTRVTARTADGINLAIRRLRTEGETRATVVLQHGLGANGRSFDARGRSLVRHLAEQGFDCFVPELRGAGRSQRPTGSFGLDEYIEQDIPAILDAVRNESGRDTVRWVGHSMGGILMMLYAIEHPDAPVDRLLAIGSALDYRPGKSVHRDTKKFRFLAGDWLPTLPFRFLSQLNGTVAGYGPLLPAEKMNFWRSNIEPEMTRHVMNTCFEPIPMRLLDDLATTFADAGLSRKKGELLYLPDAHRLVLPTCLIGGSRDAQAPTETIDETARLLRGAKDLEVVRFGKPHGHDDDYGHVDLLVGRRAQHEVWPVIGEYLGRVLGRASGREQGRA